MLLNLLNSHYRSTHKEFHNKHLGSSCFIIGGGHSIKYMDIKKFKDELIIGVNLSPFHVDFKKLNMLSGNDLTHINYDKQVQELLGQELMTL